MRPVRSWIGLVAVLAMPALALAGCGGKHGSGVATANGATAKPSATPSMDLAEKSRKFAECMRKHGIDVQVGPVDGGGGTTMRSSEGPGGGPDSAKFKAAQEACRVYAPTSGDMPKPNAQQLEQMRKFTACMRAHGVDIPDPDPDGGGVMVQRSGGAGNLGPDNPTFKAAQQACRNLMPPPQTQHQGGTR
ncbi:MAG: hypothetical protein V7603_580 [Micromonosporaceae bacterium]